MTKKKIHLVSEQLEVASTYDSFTYSQLRNLLDDKLAAVPMACMDSAVFEMDLQHAYGDSHNAVLMLKWSRPETEYERKARLARDRKAQAERDAQEREQFERLQAKFAKGKK